MLFFSFPQADVFGIFFSEDLPPPFEKLKNLMNFRVKFSFKCSSEEKKSFSNEIVFLNVKISLGDWSFSDEFNFEELLFDFIQIFMGKIHFEISTFWGIFIAEQHFSVINLTIDLVSLVNSFYWWICEVSLVNSFVSLGISWNSLANSWSSLDKLT